MYKTVRHGENSLQYTILPQQEEGVAVRHPHGSKKRSRTAVVLAVTIILICGVIATAVLVPLLFTSDLVPLPAAFQKYSISSLRRSHSGNQWQLVAKKPHGWTGPQHTTTPAPTAVTNSTTIGTTKLILLNTTQAPSTSTSTTTTTTTTRPTTEIAFREDEQEQDVTEETKKITQFPREKNILEISTTTIVSHSRDIIGDGMIVFVDTSSSPPLWNWPFQESSNFFQWAHYNTHDNLFLLVMVTGAIVTLFILVIITVWLRRRRSFRNRAIMEAMSVDAQGNDKTNLLKETAETEDE